LGRDCAALSSIGSYGTWGSKKSFVKDRTIGRGRYFTNDS
jgi:hypothetical protein